jgi:hypothetical protein
MASPACDRVLSTPELLEAILLQLTPLSNLLLAQQVSSGWRDAITSSPLLSQSLSLRAAPSSPNPSSWTVNSLLRKYFPLFFVVPKHRYTLPTFSYDSLQAMEWPNSSAPTYQKRDAFLRAEASWRRMLLVQPPPQQLHLIHLTNGQVCDYEKKAVMSFGKAGVTMGAVYDITESFLRSETASSFGLEYLNAEEAPKITLFLTHTQQCCDDMSHKAVDVRSYGADLHVRDVQWVKSRLSHEDDMYGLDMDWRTDMTVEKGGVGYEEWEKWRKYG